MSLITPQMSPKVEIAKPSEPKKMIEISREDGKTIVEINSSSLSVIQQCPRKAYYTLHRGLKSKSGSPALIYGTALHGALEVFYSAPRTERILPPNFEENLDLMSRGVAPAQEKDFLIYRAARKFLELGEPLGALPTEDKRHPSQGIYVLTEYFKTYISDPYHVYSDAKGPLTERMVSAPIYEDKHLKIIVFGTIDVILENEATRQILVCDHKTSSVVGQDFYNRLKPNHQYTGYIFLAQEALGLDTDNFLVNCVQVKARPKTSRGMAPHFPRQITKRTEEDIRDFRDTLHYYVNQYLYWREQDVWPYGDVNMCSFYGGCSYLHVCSASEAIRENIIQASYEVPNEVK